MGSKGSLVRVSDLWRWDGTIGRLSYASWGSGLVAVKYGIDTYIANVIFHRPWSWMNYISPGQAIDVLAMTTQDQMFFATMLLASLPFIWIGIVLTMRRLRAVGMPVWLCKLFFIPVVNLMFFATLCILPNRNEKNIFDRDEEDFVEPSSATFITASETPAKGLPGFIPSADNLISMKPIETVGKGKPAEKLSPSETANPAEGPNPAENPNPAQKPSEKTGTLLPPSTAPAFNTASQAPGPSAGEFLDFLHDKPSAVCGKVIHGERHLQVSQDNKWSEGSYAVLMTVPLAAFLAYASITFFPAYGWSLFIGLPFAVGMASAYLYGRNHLRSLGASVIVASIAMTILGLTVFLWAWEGMICLFMAAPIAYTLAIMGALLGYNLQKKQHLPVHARRVIMSMLIILPLTMAAEYADPGQFPTISVHTTCDIMAAPETVWKNIIAFPTLEEPKEWIFKTGIAYPVGATIKGSGVGAVRHCKFTTGNFIEPITVWNEPHLLRFGVRSQPEPMKEFSWVRDLQPAHLHGYLDVHKGEFKLIPLPAADGQINTRVVGTTWYQNRMWPGSYWRFYADNIMHAIHNRVLLHIKKLSETQQKIGKL